MIGGYVPQHSAFWRKFSQPLLYRIQRDSFYDTTRFNYGWTRSTHGKL